MRIVEIEIKNFRSIKYAKINPGMLNIQVGQNNHGKTNYFEAIRWFFSGFGTRENPDKVCRRGVNWKEMSVTIRFSGLQEAINGMTNETKKKALRSIFGDEEDIITVKRDCAKGEYKKRFLLEPSGEWSDPIGADRTWGDLLPKLEYISTKIRADDINGYKRSSPIAEMLSGVLSAIIETDKEYQKFKQQFERLFGDDSSAARRELDKLGENVQAYLQKQFPDGTKVKFSVDSPILEDLLKNFTTEVDDGILTTAEEKGDGMQRALMLSIIQAYADYRRKNKIARKFIFLIDEAELHLHPTAQRALKKALTDIASNGDQVFVNTHSSVLIADNENGGEKIYKVYKEHGITEIKPLDDKEKQSVIFELLGGSPADILLPKNFLVVEGPSESAFLEIVIDRFYSNECKGILVLSADGNHTQQERSMNMIHKAYMPTKSVYRDRAVILCDKPIEDRQEKDFNEFISSHGLVENEDYFVLPTTSLEEYYPEPWRKTAEEAKQLDQQRKKVSYAKEVAQQITQEQFEQEMPIIYKCLKKASERSFQ